MLGKERRPCPNVFALESERNFPISVMASEAFQDKVPGYFLFINRIFPIPDGLYGEEEPARPSRLAGGKMGDFDPY